MEKFKKRFIDLSKLPTREGIGALKGKEVIDWQNCAGYFVSFQYDNCSGEIKILSYNKGYLQFIYDNKNFKMHTSGFVKCCFGKVIGKFLDEFKYSISTIIQDEKRDITIIEQKRIPKGKNGWNGKYYKYKCNKCGFDCSEHYKNGIYQKELWIKEGNINKGEGCSCCHNIVIVQGINDIPTTAPWMVKYFQGGYDEAKLYTKASKKKIKPICPDCGRIKDKEMKISDLNKLNSLACICNDGNSYPNKFAYAMLEQLNSIYVFDFYEREYSPSWANRRRYDNYFEYKNKKYILEMDGALGHGQHIHTKDTKTQQETLDIDKQKDILAYKNEIKVIRIDCSKSQLEYIKNNLLKSELVNIFDMTNIDWIYCHEFATKNLCKTVCEIKRDNPDLSTLDIANIIGVSRNSITKYLKQGTLIWDWANYNADEERQKNYKNSGERNKKSFAKPIKVFKDGVFVGIFESSKQLARKSEQIFKTRLHYTLILETCHGKHKSYKGYTFEYV